jgi:hypothetical protein
MDNAEIAKHTAVAMEQNFTITLPQAMSRVSEHAGMEPAWKIETFSDTPGNVSVFIERQRQIEELLVNSAGMPVRLFQEGRASGSRAELESFTDIAATIMESRNHVLATAVQEQIINYLTMINFGIERLVDLQIGNVKQSQLFYERHPTLDPSQTQQEQEQLQEQYYEPGGENPDSRYEPVENPDGEPSGGEKPYPNYQK